MHERLSSTFHYTRSVGKYLRFNKELKDKLDNQQTYLVLWYLHGDVVHMVGVTMCKEVDHADLACGSRSSKRVAMLNIWECSEVTYE